MVKDANCTVRYTTMHSISYKEMCTTWLNIKIVHNHRVTNSYTNNLYITFINQHTIVVTLD